MKKIILLSLVSFLLLPGCNEPGDKNETQTPESLGISSQAILNFIEAAEQGRPDELHSFILMRHGKVAAQGWWNPYKPEIPHMLFSLSKSFTSTAIGIAQSEGLLSIDDRVISFFPDEAPADPSQNMKSMRIRDLLRMNTGHEDDATNRMRKDTSNWVKAFFSLEVEYKPGTRFVYNSAGTFMLSAIIQKVSGVSLLEYLTPRLFEPLGIENASWETSPEGINTGGWGLKIKTKDIASLGQLYLQKGMWQGKQILPGSWVEAATKLQTANGSDPESDWEQGYGYQFWMCRHNIYRGDGAFGQYCIVFPEQDAVLAITAGTSNMGAVMNLVWDNLLPAMEDKPVEENREAFNALQTKLSSLSLSVVKGEPGSPLAESVSNQAFTIMPNREGFTGVSCKLEGDSKAIIFERGSYSFSVPLGIGSMKKGSIINPNGEESPIESSGAWIAPDTFQVRSYLYETPFFYTYNFAFSNNDVNITTYSNVGFGPGVGSQIKGTKK